MVRLLTGFAIAAWLASPSASQWVARAAPRNIVLPLVSIGAPIPGIAYAPLFMLWFGLGNVGAVLLVGFVSAFR